MAEGQKKKRYVCKVCGLEDPDWFNGRFVNVPQVGSVHTHCVVITVIILLTTQHVQTCF